MNFAALDEYISSDSSGSSDEKPSLQPGEESFSTHNEMQVISLESDNRNGKRPRATSDVDVDKTKKPKTSKENIQVQSESRPPPPSFSASMDVAKAQKNDPTAGAAEVEARTQLDPDTDADLIGASIPNSTKPVSKRSSKALQFVPPQVRMKRPNISTEDMAAFGYRAAKKK